MTSGNRLIRLTSSWARELPAEVLGLITDVVLGTVSMTFHQPGSQRRPLRHHCGTPPGAEELRWAELPPGRVELVVAGWEGRVEGLLLRDLGSEGGVLRIVS
jgi:hypothetical protein